MKTAPEKAIEIELETKNKRRIDQKLTSSQTAYMRKKLKNRNLNAKKKQQRQYYNRNVKAQSQNRNSNITKFLSEVEQKIDFFRTGKNCVNFGIA